MSLREVSSDRLDLRVDSSLEMDSFRAVTSGSSVGTSSSSDDCDSSVAAESSTAFSSSLIRRKLVAVVRDDGGVMMKSHDVKAQRRATEFVFVGVKADDEAISVVSARAAAGRGVMMAVMIS